MALRTLGMYGMDFWTDLALWVRPLWASFSVQVSSPLRSASHGARPIVWGASLAQCLGSPLVLLSGSALHLR